MRKHQKFYNLRNYKKFKLLLTISDRNNTKEECSIDLQHRYFGQGGVSFALYILIQILARMDAFG